MAPRPAPGALALLDLEPLEDLSHLATYGCAAAGCADPAYADRGRHAPNCTQSEIDLALHEVDRLRRFLGVVRDAARDPQLAAAARSLLGDAR